jgi:hypothetical protein
MPVEDDECKTRDAMRARTILLIAVLAVAGGVGAYFGLRAARRPMAHAVSRAVASSTVQQSDRAEHEAGSLYGEWVVSGVAGASPVTALSGAEAEAMKGKTLHLNRSDLEFADQKCPATYARSEESATEFQEEYKVDAATLHLPVPVARINGGCADLYVLGPDRILFTWEGYFLEAERAAGVKQP